MSEAVLRFPDPDQVRVVFGHRDRHLRKVRDELGLSAVLRGEELRLRGDREQVRHGKAVFEELARLARRGGRVETADVSRALAGEFSRPFDPVEDGPNREFSSISPSLGESRPSPLGGASPAASAPPNGDGEAVGVNGVSLYEKSREVKPRSPGQATYIEAIREKDLVFCTGPAGCGKTYLAVAMAIHALRTDRVRKIVLARPAVEAGEKLGFLPGDMLAKVNPYLRPLLDALNDMLDYEQVRRYMAKDMIEVVPLAFMRGRTLNSTFMILDEAQNTTVTQMKMFLTRMGEESKIVVTGDVTQLDLPDDVPSGLKDAVGRLSHVEGVGVANLGRADIVRHRLVRDIVQAYDEERKD
ncbi:PhoH family protein [Alienimonas californiensis]|uniref:PhoH-like protein n=1 Tax=Alienimonas californiensis TaxID=2527989 RepID=A0A517PFL7_9PLAN|nr:PhoH family protein [Alienimonas californiensis]QDT18183.1 PhoH-like protein [Alienimonas californiensis]